MIKAGQHIVIRKIKSRHQKLWTKIIRKSTIFYLSKAVYRVRLDEPWNSVRQCFLNIYSAAWCMILMWWFSTLIPFRPLMNQQLLEIELLYLRYFIIDILTIIFPFFLYSFLWKWSETRSGWHSKWFQKIIYWFEIFRITHKNFEHNAHVPPKDLLLRYFRKAMQRLRMAWMSSNEQDLLKIV